MTFKEYSVSTAVQSVVASFWTLHSDSETEALTSYRFIPDGYLDWIFHIEEPWSYCRTQEGC